MNNYQSGIIEKLLLPLGESNQPQSESTIAAQIKNFVDEIPGGFFIYSADADERILYANKALLNIFKCDNFSEFRELTHGSFRGIVHPDDLAETEKSIAEQIDLSPDNMDYVEYRIICKDGTVRRVEDFGHFAHTASGDVFYVFISDATEKINSRLQERLQRLEIIEGLSVNYDSILYFDLEDDTVLPYRLSHRMKNQFNTKWGVRKYNELMKEYIATWVHPDDCTSVLEKLSPAYMSHALTDVPTYYFNYRCIEKGEIIHLQLRIVNVGKKNTANKFVFGFRRIDEEILREIKQKEILEDALKTSKLAEVAKNTFLANMSHDMRTPLNAIFGFSALARKNLSDRQSIEYYLDRIDDAGKQILDLIAKVLEASDTKTQDLIVQESDCNLAELLEDVCDTARAQGMKNSLDIRLNLDGLTHRDVFADGEKLRKTIWYLVENAVKFNKKGGAIEIAAEEKAHGEESSRTYRFTVTDTGIGISPNALERIFEPFEREKDTTESGISGAGLGLTFAKHNAEKMGGSISVESVKGAGSTFTLTLHLKLPRPDQGTNGKIRIESLSGLKVLLVDDNEINMEIAVDILQDEGLIVDTAANGKIAVDKIKNSPADTYDFVLMDIQMPVMDGWQATDEIRALDKARAEIPVIALSANALEKDKRLSMQHGMNAHLAKPLDLELIKKTVAEILNHRKK